jgi:hypothetical protein
MVEKLSCCSDTGEFTLQHYAWNLHKVGWCEVVDMAPRTAFRAISKQNTLKVAQRILKDSELISPCQKAATVVFAPAADGYYNIDAEHAIPDSTAQDLLADAFARLSQGSLSWNVSIKCRTEERVSREWQHKLDSSNESIASWFCFLTNLCMLEKVLHDILDG